jgi:hypothetical protein
VGLIASLAAQEPPPERQPSPVNLPSGWEPGVRWSNDTASGTIVTDTLDAAPDAAVWAEIIADWGLDPATMVIVDGSIELIGWDAPIKGTDQRQRLKRYKARLRQRHDVIDAADVESLCVKASRRRPSRKAPAATDDVERALVVCLSDWQVGKGEGGGSAATVDRIASSIAGIVPRLKDLERLKRGADVVYLVGMGDLVEQCSCHYPSQEFTTDLNRREQMRVVRRLILAAVDTVVDAGYRVVLTGVPGNHGENRKDGKAYTTVDDNDDLAVIEQVGEVLSANPARYEAVSVFLPSETSMALDVAGVPVGFTHGHTARGGANPAAKIEKWWTGQVMGFQPVADARILITGQYHHLLVSESTGRTHMQCPAMDGGSAWWTSSTGQSSPSGMLSLVVSSALPRGWGDLEVL